MGGYYCIDCGKKLANHRPKRCWTCHIRYKDGHKGDNNPNWRGGEGYYNTCPECSCRKRTVSKLCSHCSKLGNRNPSWKNGSTEPHSSHYAYSQYQRLKKVIFKEYAYSCALCGKTGRRELEIHHIRVNSKFPNLALSLANVIPLCRNCHNKTKGKETNYEETLMVHVKPHLNNLEHLNSKEHGNQRQATIGVQPQRLSDGALFSEATV